MATAELTEIINEDFLTCKICMEIYTDPKVLPCFHSYCIKCLHRIVAKAKADSTESKPATSFPCPECRYKVPIDEEGVDGLRNNFFIMNLQDVFQSTSSQGKVCQNCEEEAVAQSKCVECNHFLCADCEKAHKKMKLLKDHHVLSLDQLQQARPEDFSSAPIKCKDHGEPLQLHCIECDCAICITCKAVGHNDHKCSHLQISATADKPKIEQSLKSMKDLLPNIGKALDIVEKQMVSMDKMQQNVYALMDQQKQLLFDTVNKIYMQQKAKLDSVCSARQKILQLSKEALEFQKGSIESSLQFNQCVLQHGQNAEIVAARKHLEIRIHELMKDIQAHSVKDNVVVNYTIEPSRRSRMATIQEMFGKINHAFEVLPVPVLGDMGFRPIGYKSELLHSFVTKEHEILSLAVTANDDILVANNTSCVQVYSKTGEFQGTMKSSDLGNAIAVVNMPNGNIVVAYTSNNTVVEYDGNNFKHVCNISIDQSSSARIRGFFVSTDFSQLLYIAGNKLGQSKFSQKIDKNTWYKCKITTITGIEYGNGIGMLKDGSIVISERACVHIVKNMTIVRTIGDQTKIIYWLNPLGNVVVDQFDNILIADPIVGVRMLHVESKSSQLDSDKSILIRSKLQLHCMKINNQGNLIVGENRSYKMNIYNYTVW